MIKRINVLDQNTSNKIAAGEVVERPSSVVKELVENSIDAGAKNITVEIEEGGGALIRIIDDGHGIHPEDVKKAFMPHATSKIKEVDDIYNIQTLGFRGEALASIASVSKVTVKTKIEDEPFGRELIIEGGEIIDFKEYGCNNGTTIEVKDLFFNVPARLKFLKSSSREGSIIGDILNRIALSHPEISFKFYNNSKKALSTFGTGSSKDVIRTIYGKTISDNIISFENHGDLLSIYGFIGKEEISRGTRNNQSIFVNGRYIKNKTIVAAVENAFKSFSTVNKYPFFTLFIEIYPEFVDVNIHPTKAEIKFKDDRVIFKKVFDTVHGAFKNEVFNSFSFSEEESKDELEEAEERVEKLSFNMEEKEIVTLPLDINSAIEEELKEKERLKNLVFEPSSKKTFENREENYSYKKEGSTTYKVGEEDFNLDLPFKKEETSSCEVAIDKDFKNDEIKPSPLPKFPPLRIIGQFNKTYILGEYADTLFLIDQHAAHEKILFEKYLKSIEEGSIIIQPLLVPSLVHLTVDDYSYFIENEEVFKNAGFTIEEFGGNTLAIKEVPYFLGKIESKNLFLSILDNVKSLGSGTTAEVKYNKIATMACKAAVKANDKLEVNEMTKLIEELRYIDDPFHCPHGRPTIIKFTSYDLDKKFRRIV